MGYKCGKCNVEMEEVFDIITSYNEMELPEAQGLRCPECNTEFLLEDFVISDINSAEQMLETK